MIVPRFSECRCGLASYAGPVEATMCRATLARTMLDDRSSGGPSPRNRNSASSDSHSSYTLTRSDSTGSAATTKSRQPSVCRACATAAAERARKFCLVPGRTWILPETMIIYPPSFALPYNVRARPPPRRVSAPRLKQLHWVARRVIDNDLGAARPGHDILRAEGNPGRTQPLNFRGQIGHLQVHAVPAARYLPATVRQRTLSRAAIAAEEEAHAVPCDRREGWRGVLLQCEPEECRIEMHRSRDVINHVAHADPGHRYFLLRDVHLTKPPDAAFTGCRRQSGATGG